MNKFLSPEELYGSLFYDVQLSRIFPDSKTFVDCSPKYPVKDIIEKYAKLKKKTLKNIRKFVYENFETPHPIIEEYISNFWEKLKVEPRQEKEGTLLPLKKPFIAPGGNRFNKEWYYWDTLSNLLGIPNNMKIELICNHIDNIVYLLDEYELIPNGSRSYYLSRSQPPVLALIIGLLKEIQEEDVYIKYVPYMEKEIDFWNDGIQFLSTTNNAYRRVVMLNKGEVLNRYYDDMDKPRPEMYLEDVKTAKLALKNNISSETITYRHIRAAAESSADFSSRWLADYSNLYTIRTTDIIPIDLNCLLYQLEITIAEAFKICKHTEKSDFYYAKAEQRRANILKYFWNDETNWFHDFDWKNSCQTPVKSLAGIYTMFTKVATPEQACLMAKTIKESFLKKGGVVYSLCKTKQQWDWPFCHSPLIWITIQALRQYSFFDLANSIKKRWMSLVEETYYNSYHILEKYDVVNGKNFKPSGEYKVQTDFAWSISIYSALLNESK